jgi:predicted small secreted protein
MGMFFVPIFFLHQWCLSLLATLWDNIIRKAGEKMKKLASVLALFLVGSMLTSGCGGGEKAQTKGKSIKELKIAVAPYKDAKTVQTKIAPLGDLLKKKMQEKGYNIDAPTCRTLVTSVVS